MMTTGLQETLSKGRRSQTAATVCQYHAPVEEVEEKGMLAVNRRAA